MDVQKVLFSGGGTLGSVTPLLAIYEQLQLDSTNRTYAWIGTKSGPEKKLVDTEGIPYYSIAAGKFRRYFSLRNFFDPALVIVGFFQALSVLRRERPDWVLTAGGFVAVPVAWAARLLRIPVAIHQQDVVPGLANKLMVKFAQLVTVTFTHSLDQFSHTNKHVIGNPVRTRVAEKVSNAVELKKQFSITSDLPVLLIVGGGTGALFLNKIIEQSITKLVDFCEIIHLTGGKADTTIYTNLRYHQYDLLTDMMPAALQLADLVVTRAGMSSLSELAVLGKPCIIVPIPHSHQEHNAKVFARNNAALVAQQDVITPDSFVESVRLLLNDNERRQTLSANIQQLIPRTAAQKLVALLYQYDK